MMEDKYGEAEQENDSNEPIRWQRSKRGREHQRRLTIREVCRNVIVWNDAGY